MLKPLGLVSLLLVSSNMVAAQAAYAQARPEPEPVPTQAEPQPTAEEPVEEVEVSAPGAAIDTNEIVVTGQRTPNITRSAPEVVSILSSADIARTGEGDIAGALSRVTGLSVVGNGFVYVRGLGDRYSLALLNGSPLSSPEPLKRVVPLDLFPTSVVASSLVQKSYSVNFPGEFGGGVINLTTKAVPKDAFFQIGGALSVDSQATSRLGYTHYGSSIDWTGFTNANRNLPPALSAYLSSGERISAGNVDTQEIAGQLFNGRNAVVQRNDNLPANASLSLSAGKSWDVADDVRLGLIATAGYSNKWRNRDTLQQTASNLELTQRELDFRRFITDNRIVVNGLLGFGLEVEDHKFRWTNLYIRDTLKQSRLGIGSRATTSLTATLLQQDTAWFERQLIDSHAVAELKLTPEISFDIRGGYANSQREAPMEYSFEYFRSNIAEDPFGNAFVNRLNNGQQGSANASFSDLNEDLWSYGLDLSYKISPKFTATIGYAFTDVSRRTERRDFLVRAPSSFPTAVAGLRPDLLLNPNVINAFDIELIDVNEGNPVFQADLRNDAAYAQIQADILDGLSINAGVRYETALQTVSPVQVFKVPTISLASTRLKNDYWLPAVTLTYEVTPEMQLRLNASKTIARPQFRELIFQRYFDPEANRNFNGNPLLTDSQLYNAEARYEWYFARDQRVSVAGFFKRIDNPIETFSSFNDNSIISSYANAPRADLYGAELEAQKYFSLESLGDAFASRRAVAVVNYTYTQSKLRVKAGDPVAVFAQSSRNATDFFRDGVPLTGQSDHLANLQLGLEDTDRLSQQTILVTWASQRVTSRGAGLQADIIEKPGFRVDFVAREGFNLFGAEGELTFEARNLTRTRYQEFQKAGENKVFLNRYRIGTTVELGVSLKF